MIGSIIVLLIIIYTYFSIKDLRKEIDRNDAIAQKEHDKWEMDELRAEKEYLEQISMLQDEDFSKLNK